MKFETKEPDIETMVGRIKRGTIDLQPDFQRGEVWSNVKKQRLIDSILRRWHIPPIHLVAKGGGKFDVLDGQQRLTAIRDFVNNKFAVAGGIEPADPEIEAIVGLRYSKLPDAVRDEFNTFPLRVFELRDYSPQEPHELFFRLNQPTNLTEAEKRNAFMGGPRNQVKELVTWATASGMTPTRIGFSNARMAYDDLLARFLITIEQGTLEEKVTAQRITSRYREPEPFSELVMAEARGALSVVLSLSVFDARDEGFKPNKATIQTWLFLSAKLHKAGLLGSLSDAIAHTVERIERSRFARDQHVRDDDGSSSAIGVFHDRATSRVADVSSVVLRDLIAWMFLMRELEEEPVELTGILGMLQQSWRVAIASHQPDKDLYEFAVETSWGGHSWL